MIVPYDLLEGRGEKSPAVDRFLPDAFARGALLGQRGEQVAVRLADLPVYEQRAHPAERKLQGDRDRDVPDQGGEAEARPGGTSVEV